MRVVVATHPAASRHDTGRLHPERMQRIGAVLRGIEESGLQRVDVEAAPAGRSDLALVHDPDYIERIESFCLQGGGHLDLDTVVTPDSWMAALTAVGSVQAAVDAVARREDATGFAVIRPPGHHALPDRAMGFCLFNNVAVAASRLRAEGRRVAIVDWDVHHGNGTQTMVGRDPGILYISLHQSRFYPFEGRLDDIDLDAKGTVVNIPLRAGTAGDVYRRAWAELAMPVLAQFDPDWVLVSAGYDAHVSDPLAELRLIEADYGWMAHRLASVHPPHRTVFALEGGYDLDALRSSVAATLRGLAGVGEISPPLGSEIGSQSDLEQAREAVARHWSVE